MNRFQHDTSKCILSWLEHQHHHDRSELLVVQIDVDSKNLVIQPNLDDNADDVYFIHNDVIHIKTVPKHLLHISIR